MATWKMNSPKEFRIEFIHKDNSYRDLAYERVSHSWEYHTVSDVLEIKREHPQMREEDKTELMGPDQAAAQLFILADWYATYNGKDKLKELLKKQLE